MIPRAIFAWLLLLALLAAQPGWAQSPPRGGEAPESGVSGGADPSAVRGEQVFRAAGGCGCHTDYEGGGARLAGGRPIETPFGTLYGTNITPDPATGLGRWSEWEFVRAMTRGLGRDGSHLFPVFPYTSFTRMAGRDLRDLWAYLATVPPVKRPNRPHEMWPPFGWRFTVGFWKTLFFQEGPWRPDPARDAQWNRGAYLVQAVAHCAECHTPRNLAGALDTALYLAGSVDGPEGQLAPNLTPDSGTGLGEWSAVDIVWYLQTGSDADGDQAEGLMSEMIEHGFSEVPEADLRAIAAYLRALPPIENKLEPKEE